MLLLLLIIIACCKPVFLLFYLRCLVPIALFLWAIIKEVIIIIREKNYDNVKHVKTKQNDIN